MSKFDYLFDGDPVEVSIDKKGDRVSASVNGNAFEFVKNDDNSYKMYQNGQKFNAAVVKQNSTYYIDIDSVLIEITEPSADEFAGGGGGQAGEKDKIFAPMPGKIVKILVAVGDEVTEKQPMVIVEAMKMENQVNSKAAGKVKAVNFKDGEQVDTDSPIIELELPE